MKLANNPVSRLYILLSGLPDENSPIGEYLSKEMGIDDDKILTEMRLYTDLVELTGICVEKINQFQGFDSEEIQDLNKPLFAIYRVLARHSHTAGCYDVKSDIGLSTLAGLRVTARFIGRDHPEIEIDSDQLDELLESVHELTKFIIASDIHEDLKSALLKNTDRLAMAIRDYRIHGESGLKNAIESAIGSAFLVAAQNPEEAHKENFTEVLKRYSIVCNYFMTLLNLAFQGKQILEPLINQVGMLPEGSE